MEGDEKPKKKKRDIISAEELEKIIPKPLLDLSSEDIRSYEISPKGTYMVVNSGTFVFIVNLTQPDRLIKVMKPMYLTCEKGVTPIVQASSGPISLDKVKEAIRKKIKDNPNSLLEDFVKSYDVLATADEMFDFEK